MRCVSITIFLFLILLIPSAVAETEYFQKSASQQYHADYITGGAMSGVCPTNVLMFNDIGTTHGISSITLQVDNYNWYGGKSSGWSDVEYRLGSPTGALLGTGSYGFNNGTSYVFVIATFDKPNSFSDYTGAQKVFIVGGPNVQFGASPVSTTYRIYNPANIDTTTITTVYLGFKTGANYYASVGDTGHDSNSELDIYLSYDFINSYTYYNDGVLNKLEVERTDNQSIWTVERGGNTIFGDYVLNSTDFQVYDNDLDNSTWDIMCNDSYGNTYTDTFLFTVDTISYGTVELNQSSYTEPELIQMDIELTTYDFTDHSYYIITEVREDEGSWDNVAGTYNGTTKITTATATKILDIDTWLYDLPLWVRVKLVDYNKISGEYSTIYTTGMVRYNSPTPDSIKFGGTVIDADTNQIISGATVSVEGVTTASDTTNAWGEFLMYIYPGIYTVNASKTGYQTYTSEELLMEVDNTWAQIYLTPIGYGNGTLYGNVNDVDTGYAIQDVHVIITNATDSISAYTSSGGYYEATGLAQSSTYTIQAVKSGYYTYNGSVTTEATGATHKSFTMVPTTATPTPTPTVTATSTYPGGEGYEWTNDDIVTMLRVIVPGFFMLMLVFLLLAVMLGIGGNNGNGGQGRSGLSEIWRR